MLDLNGLNELSLAAAFLEKGVNFTEKERGGYGKGHEASGRMEHFAKRKIELYFSFKSPR